ncbi:Lrp/AsnC family transcriptional regulator [Massilia sp. TS11]|uniref:Lrp/AsnC family transcriptional regulator n=1 Tax=Massilia sp. TS11 TaxID=2908003 RepID=UPI001EDBAB6D|nr:Lrp/AsnC family transcriptional regulator [Massilia sp. TS11]MCG2583547.1 Lrp/AsnC family transcriptional regulator [Massilia sp. TS11]
MSLDRIDRELLALLARDGRQSYKELGEQVHLSPNAVAERVRQLQARGHIRGVHADVDPAALGLHLQALVEVKLQAGAPAARFESFLRGLPGVVGATLLAGSYDYALRLAVRDQNDFVRVLEALRASGDVLDTQSRMILREVMQPGNWPDVQ